MASASTCRCVLTPYKLRQRTGARYDLGSIRAGRREHPVVSDQVESWRWHEGSQLLQQLLGRQQELARTIRPRRLEREDQRLLIHEAQPTAGHGRSNQLISWTALWIDRIKRHYREFGVPDASNFAVAGPISDW